MDVFVVIFFIILLAGVVAYLYFIYSPPKQEPSLSSKATSKEIIVGNTNRSYIEYKPANLTSNNPLVIVLHGTQQNGSIIRYSTGYEFDLFADAHRFTVIYPTGIGGAWNDCRPKDAKAAAIDDVGFINTLIAQAVAEHTTEPQHIYLFGYSNGGQMVFRLLSEQPDRFMGAAVVGANLPTPEFNQCQIDRPTPKILLANGTADPIVPFEGGKVTIFGIIGRGFALSAEQTGQIFADRNHTDIPTRDTISPEVDHWVWRRQGVPYIERYAFKGAGHVIPQPLYRFPRLMGRTPSFDLLKKVIHFFDFIE